MSKFERNIRLIVLLITLLLAIFAYSKALAQTPSGSIFAAQCGQMNRAYIYNFVSYSEQRIASQYWIRDLNRLQSLQVTPGVWYGYNSAAPFGGTYPNGGGYWQGSLLTKTPCGDFWTWAWNNGDDTLILFAFYNLQSNCDANGQHCGAHNFEFYYTTADEWQRVIRR